MKRAKLYLALLLFCFQSGAFSVPISEDVQQKEYEIIRYSYKGHIDTKTSAFNETIARWTISGDLYGYKYPDFYYMKLDNVKTSVFNGPISNLENVEEKPIPPEAEVIQQMFAVKIKDDFSVTLHFKENEPLWSINMKKGIYNFFQFEYEKPTEKDGKILPPVDPEGYCNEESLYGKCIYHVTQDGLVVTKTTSNLNCTNVPIQREANFYNVPGINLQDIVDYKYKKVLTLKKQGQKYLPYTTVLKTSAEFKNSPSGLYTQIIEQEQSFEVLEMYVSVEKIDASEFTKETDLIYQISEDNKPGKRVKERNSTELAKKFLENYDEFAKKFNYSTPEYYNVRENYIFNMYEILKLLGEGGFKEFENVITDRKDVFDLGYTFVSLIPYVGSKSAVEYLINYLKSERIYGNIGYVHKIFATFPRYIKNLTDEMLIKMEPFINHSTMHTSLKSAAVLSFASTIGHNCHKHGISKKYITKYIEFFHKDFLEKENYEERMVKLMGLVNMASCIDYELINSIATNTSESSHLRVLALAGFNDYLRHSQVYEIYWPIVQNKSEPFEVRVRALDLLLSSQLTEDQFKTIVSKYSESVNDPEEKQLANYVLSTLHSIKKTTGYSDYLGKYALEALKDNRIPIHPKGLASGYYRLSYTDTARNFGYSFDVRLITDPKTNILDTIQVTFNNFKHFVDYGTYTLYFKFHGFFDWTGVKSILDKTKDVSSVPELINLLKEYNYETKFPVTDGHIDIVFFVDDIAVFARHFSKFEPNELYKLGYVLDDFISAFQFVSFPTLEYVHIPSDFGTPIEVNYYEQEISRLGLGRRKEIKYRSSWSLQTRFEIYNPLADTYITNYKYDVDEKNMFFNFSSISLKHLTLKWLNEKDSYTQFWDHMLGTMAEKDALQEYCPKCEAYSEFEADYFYSTTKSFEALGFKANIQAETYYEKIGLDDIMLDFMQNEELHQYNVDALPYSGPILFFANVLNYKYWLRSDLSRGSIKTYSINGNDTSSETEWKFSVQIPEISDFGRSSIYRAHFESNVRNVENNETLNSINMTAMLDWNTDFQGSENETVEHKIVKLLKFYMKYDATEPKNSMKVCGYGSLHYPNTRKEILSLLPFESITQQTKLILAKNIEDDEDCIPEYCYTLTEVYSSNNIEVELEKENFKKDYEKCSADSEGLKFTAPTEECKKVSSRITEYDDYKAYFKTQVYNETHNVTYFDTIVPFFKYSRLDENTINVTFTNINDELDVPNFNKFFNFKIYYPQTIAGPVEHAYNKDNSGILPDARSTCTITPSNIDQFSGKYIPNQKNELLAFANCYNKPSIGLKARIIDDKHVGFTFYSFNNIIEATVKDGKAYITLNGKQITEFFSAEDQSIKIYFLGADVAYIIDSNVEIYYNTEYVATSVNALYPKIFCGVCTQ